MYNLLRLDDHLWWYSVADRLVTSEKVIIPKFSFTAAVNVMQRNQPNQEKKQFLFHFCPNLMKVNLKYPTNIFDAS